LIQGRGVKGVVMQYSLAASSKNPNFINLGSFLIVIFVRVIYAHTVIILTFKYCFCNVFFCVKIKKNNHENKKLFDITGAEK
jgi:hypothetical protein